MTEGGIGMRTITTEPRLTKRPEIAAGDRGCRYAPRCVDCPWVVCIQTLGEKKAREFGDAWALLQRYLVPPEAAGPVAE